MVCSKWRKKKKGFLDIRAFKSHCKPETWEAKIILASFSTGDPLLWLTAPYLSTPLPKHCLCLLMSELMCSCLALRLFLLLNLYFVCFSVPPGIVCVCDVNAVCASFTSLQLVSVMVTVSASMRACVKSARIWQPAATARAASPASTGIRPMGAAASVSILGALSSALNHFSFNVSLFYSPFLCLLVFWVLAAP